MRAPYLIAFIVVLVPSTQQKQTDIFLFPIVFHLVFPILDGKIQNQLKLDKCSCEDLSSSYAADFSLAFLCSKKYMFNCFYSIFMIDISDTYCWINKTPFLASGGRDVFSFVPQNLLQCRM